MYTRIFKQLSHLQPLMMICTPLPMQPHPLLKPLNCIIFTAAIWWWILKCIIHPTLPINQYESVTVNTLDSVDLLTFNNILILEAGDIIRMQTPTGAKIKMTASVLQISR